MKSVVTKLKGTVAIGAILAMVASCAHGRTAEKLEPAAPPVQLAQGDVARIQTAYGQLPLFFIRNDGQTSEEVRFYEKGNGRRTSFTKDGIYVSLTRADRTAESAQESGGHASEVVKLVPLGANPNPIITAEGRQDGTVNYLVGNDPGRWRRDVPTYRAIVYEELYPGIDAKFYGTNRQLEYDIIVKPGADPATVRLAYEGAKELRVTDAGELSIRLKDGEIRQRRPVLYQDIEGTRIEVAGGFRLAQGGGPFVYGFEVASYDPTYPLVIDPIVDYSTYLGGVDNFGHGIGVDQSGNVYVMGVVDSGVDFPATSPTPPALGGGFDVFVTKLNPDGTALLYSTFLGGSADEGAAGIPFGDLAVDSSGNAYVTGWTFSADFPTVNAAQPMYAGNGDAFLAKLDPTGSVLVYSTFLGGAGLDQGVGVAVVAGNAHVTGETRSVDFPNVNSVQATLQGPGDAFIAKLDGSGTTILYATYLGGSGLDFGGGIAADTTGNVWVIGSTNSADFPTTGNSLQPTLGGSDDAFVVKLQANGALEFATYWGGNGADFGGGIAVDVFGNAYLTGTTASIDFPTSSPAQDTLLGGQDAFVTKLGSTGQLVPFSTFLGGTGGEIGVRIALDDSGKVYVAGFTDSPDFPSVEPIPAAPADASHSFVAQLSAIGDQLLFSSYIGGTGQDVVEALAVDGTGNMYLAGWTTSTDFPIASPLQIDLNGFVNAFVAKVGPVTSDSDGDGLPDDWEATNGLNPTDATGANGPDGDPDGDGAANVWEYLGETDPQSGASVPQSAITEYRSLVINYPGASRTTLSGVNDHGTAVGRYDDAAGHYHGLLWKDSHLSALDCPGATDTTLVDINNVGQVVGIASYLGSELRPDGFVREPAGGPCITIDRLGFEFASVVASDINDVGQVVGNYVPVIPTFDSHGFLRQPSGATTQIDVPGAASTVVNAINNAGRIVGSYEVAVESGDWHGFVREPSGIIGVVDFPGATATFAVDINDAGDITGYFQDGIGSHSFRLREGVFTRFDASGVGGTSFGVRLNNSEELAGTWFEGSGGVAHGYVVDGGEVLPVTVPGATTVRVKDLNNRGDVVGSYEGGAPLQEGAFIAIPTIDVDGDGLPNGWEMQYGYAPDDPTDAALDSDADGFNTLEEYVGNSDPLAAPSTPEFETILDGQGRPIRVVVPADVSANPISWVDPATLPPPPSGELPFGLVSMSLQVPRSGAMATVALTFPTAVAKNFAYQKYGPTVTDPLPHWYTVPFGSNDGDRTITLTLIDGQTGDHDLVANRVIVDPGGPVLLDPRLVNASTRAFVQTGDNVLIGGFIVDGDVPKTVLVRVRGPSLAEFGVSDAIANPYVEVYSGPTKIAQNDNWQTTDPLCGAPAVSCGSAAEISVTNLDPCDIATTGCTLDSAIMITLPPGPYTAVVRGVGGVTGVANVGVFDLDPATEPKMVNISSRGLVQTGNRVMIGGFIVGGSGNKTVLLRVRGPSLAAAGVAGPIANPYVELYSGSTKIAQNDNWQTTDPLCGTPAVSCGNAADIQATGLAPCSITATGCTLDSAILVTLPPGPYTAIVRGVGGATGVANLGAFDLSP